MSDFLCRIATPEKIVFEGEVSYLNAETLMGPTGILAHHAALISPLRAGKVELHLPNKTCLNFKVSDGFLKVDNNLAEIFSPEVKTA
ncbi:MAG: F0F1 ATP synthase subunit epsilon [Candidatus Margulisiibacteriota bacterium]